MKSTLLAIVMALGPVGLYIASAMRPQTVGMAGWVALAALIACVIAAAFKRRGAVAGAILVIVAAMFVPKSLWMLHIERCGMRELAVARARVEDFRQAHKRPPADLEELGPLPRLNIWTIGKDDQQHFHPATTRVAIFRGGGTPPDDGGWGYDPDQGRVFISCSGFEPKSRHTLLHEL